MNDTLTPLYLWRPATLLFAREAGQPWGASLTIDMGEKKWAACRFHGMQRVDDGKDRDTFAFTGLVAGYGSDPWLDEWLERLGAKVRGG